MSLVAAAAAAFDNPGPFVARGDGAAARPRASSQEFRFTHVEPQAAGARTLRIASHPERNPGNPYVELFYAALAQHGIEHVGRLVPDARWLTGAGAEVDVVHIHWPDGIWRGKRRGRLDALLAAVTARSARGVLRLRRFLVRAGDRAVTRVWTVHNLAHHEGASAVDRWGYRVLARHCDLLLCFSEAAAADIRRTYGSHTPVIVISHGSYRGAYPPPGDKGAARARFGLRRDVPVVSCLGLIRPYKGVELACGAVEGLRGRVQLLIAGAPRKSFDIKGLLQRAAASGGSIVVLPRALSEDEFAEAMVASDAVLLPYRAVTGSGVLFAAWTLGAGVIASDLPFFAEMLDGSPLLGRTFRSGDSRSLAAAIDAYLDLPEAERRRAAAAAAERLAPERVVVPFVEALRSRHPGRAGRRESVSRN